MRIPRKLKKQIPNGFYCYDGIRFDFKTGVYHIKPCVFYDIFKRKDVFDYLDKWTKEVYEEFDNQQEKDDFVNVKIGWCKLCKCEPLDQTKSCGLKYGKY